MKNLVKIMIISLAFSMTACSSDDKDSEPVKEPSAKIVVENNTVLAIPDGVSATVAGVAENAVAVNVEGVIADASKVSIKLDLQHPWAGDLAVQLFAPSGESCTLFKRIGAENAGTNRDFLSGNVLTFNSKATVDINEMATTGVATNIPAGTYLPGKGFPVFPEAIVITDLANFLAGKSIKGDWKIKVSDCSGTDTGKLNKWALEFETGALE